MTFFFFNDTATTEIYTLSLHDALPILLKVAKPGLTISRTPIKPTSSASQRRGPTVSPSITTDKKVIINGPENLIAAISANGRSEEHTSELQSRQYLVCRLLLEKKKLTE